MSRDFIKEAYARMKSDSQGLPWRGKPNRRPQARAADLQLTQDEGWKPPPGFARSLGGTGKSVRDPRKLDSVLRQAASRRKWGLSLSMGQIIAVWPQIVGASVAQHSVIESLEDGRLFVRADSTAWAKQLQLLVPQIEKRVDEVVGVGTVKQVIVHGPERPSWKHGPRAVPGRGPRDTYG